MLQEWYTCKYCFWNWKIKVHYLSPGGTFISYFSALESPGKQCGNVCMDTIDLLFRAAFLQHNFVVVVVVNLIKFVDIVFIFCRIADKLPECPFT